MIILLCCKNYSTNSAPCIVCHQSVTQSASNPSNESISQPVSRPASQSVCQPISQSVSHVTSQPVNHSASRSFIKSAIRSNKIVGRLLINLANQSLSQSVVHCVFWCLFHLVTGWSGWSSCSASCGSFGTQRRYRYAIVNDQYIT